MNSRTPSHYRVSITDMFDHCSNFRVGSTILYDVYQRALKIDSNKQSALFKPTNSKRPVNAISYAQTIIDLGDIYDTP